MAEEISEATLEPLDTSEQDAEITKLEYISAGELFGAKLVVNEGQDPEAAKARRFLRVSFEGNGFGGRTAIPWTSAHPKSKATAFINRYKAVPKVGMLVKAAMNPETGYMDLVV